VGSHSEKPQPGDTVVLAEIPLGLLDGLPPEDQQAISEVLGKPLALNGYDEDGRAELEFRDRDVNALLCPTGAEAQGLSCAACLAKFQSSINSPGQTLASPGVGGPGGYRGTQGACATAAAGGQRS
jgi:hypothetical protein